LQFTSLDIVGFRGHFVIAKRGRKI